MGTVEAVKAKASVIWSSAPYEELSVHHLSAIEHALDRLGDIQGATLLDIATGTGELARAAAKRGASVTAQDIAPAMVETAKQRAEEEGVELRCSIGDAESLDHPDGSFDIVASTFGVMFTPDQERAAREIARVCRPGGRLVLTTWTPEGGVGRLIGTMRPYQTPPPEGVGNPMDWGRREHVELLLGEDFDLDFETGDARQHGESGRGMWELLERTYGPTKALAASLPADRRAELERDVIAFYDAHRSGSGISLSREYLLTVGSKKERS